MKLIRKAARNRFIRSLLILRFTKDSLIIRRRPQNDKVRLYGVL